MAADPNEPLAEARAPAGDELTERILSAALRQYELFGLKRSTIDDIARRAGLARVTIYRRFPQKEKLVQTVILREVFDFLERLRSVTLEHEQLEDRIVEGFVFTLHAIREHRLLGRLLESEPESLVPFLTTDGGPLIALATRALAGELSNPARPTRELETVSELVVRFLLSLLLTPDSGIPLRDDSAAREFARSYLAPLLTAGTR